MHRTVTVSRNKDIYTPRFQGMAKLPAEDDINALIERESQLRSFVMEGSTTVDTYVP